MSKHAFYNLWFVIFVGAIYIGIPVTVILLRRFGSEKAQQRLDKLETSLRGVQGTPHGLKIAAIAIGCFVAVSLVLIFVLTRNHR